MRQPPAAVMCQQSRPQPLVHTSTSVMPVCGRAWQRTIAPAGPGSDAESRGVAHAEKLGRYDLRRCPKQPREGFTISNLNMVTVAPIPYDVLKEGVVQ